MICEYSWYFFFELSWFFVAVVTATRTQLAQLRLFARTLGYANQLAHTFVASSIEAPETTDMKDLVALETSENIES